jgi:hypothetical protein
MSTLLKKMVHKHRERRAAGDEQMFSWVTIYGNSPEELRAEEQRLKQEGKISRAELIDHQPRRPNDPAYKVHEMPMLAFRQLLQEIDGKTRGLPGCDADRDTAME